MKRRDFLKTAGTATALLGCFPATLSAVEREQPRGKIERRTLGQTGAKLSMLGFGGFILKNGTPEQARDWVRLACDAGVTYFDAAPAYGKAEELLGPVLEPLRKDIFLSCKTAKRKQVEAQADLENSLKVLRTDHFDLYQLHHVTTMEEVETIFGPDGAIKTLEAARQAGKVRFLGFSAHSVEAAMALMDRFNFDSIMFPVNYATWHAGNFGPQVLARAQENASLAGVANIQFREGSAEALPFPDNSFGVVISNGVFNLVVDKLQALREVFRVLKPGGRFMVADQVLAGELPQETQARIDKWAS